MSVGTMMRRPESSSSRQASTWPGSSSESPTGWPRAARKVKHIPPPTSRTSTRSSRERITPILSLALAPPSTAAKGRAGWWRSPPSTSTSLASRRPAALGSLAGGPTMEAWARWEAPKASFTNSSLPATRRSTKAGSLASSPGSKRRFSMSSTPGARTGASWPLPARAARQLQQVDEPVGVAPLVVVPAEHLGQALAPVQGQHHRQRGVEDAGGGRAHDVGGHDRVLRVHEDPGHG